MQFNAKRAYTNKTANAHTNTTYYFSAAAAAAAEVSPPPLQPHIYTGKIENEQANATLQKHSAFGNSGIVSCERLLVIGNRICIFICIYARNRIEGELATIESDKSGNNKNNYREKVCDECNGDVLYEFNR